MDDEPRVDWWIYPIAVAVGLSFVAGTVIRVWQAFS